MGIQDKIAAKVSMDLGKKLDQIDKNNQLQFNTKMEHLYDTIKEVIKEEIQSKEIRTMIRDIIVEELKVD